MSLALSNGKSEVGSSSDAAASSSQIRSVASEIAAIANDQDAVAARLAEFERCGVHAAISKLDAMCEAACGGDAHRTVEAFMESVADLVGCEGVRVLVQGAEGGRIAGSRGIDGVIARALDGAGLDRCESDGHGGRSFVVASAPILAGTFLQGLLREHRVASLFVRGIAAADGAVHGDSHGKIHGTVHLLCGDDKCLSKVSISLLDALCARLAGDLEAIRNGATSHGCAAQLRAIVESAHDSIISMDGRGVIQSINATTTRMLGYASEDLVGHTLDVMLSDADREILRSGISSAGIMRFAAGRERGPAGSSREVEVRGEVEVRCKDGTQVIVDLAVIEIEGDRGFACIMRDISTRKRVEAQMRDSDRLAAIGTLAAGLGHDMSNMLFPIRAHLNVLASNEKRLPRERRDMHIAEIRAGVTYLQHLADSLHFLAMDPDAEGDGIGVTDLWTWWKQTGPLLKNALRRSADLEVAIALDLPPIVVPQHALTRAVLNILVNAGEAMPKDRPRELAKVVLRAHVTAGGDAVLLEIADNGTGMPEEVRRRALDMFFTTKTRGIGTGLGLPLARGVVERAGGSLDIDSRVGLGTTIRLRLPVAVEPESEAGPSAWVQMSDGRAASIVRSALEARGVSIELAGQFDGVDLRVVDRGHISLDEARRWIAVHPAPHLVVIGPLSTTERRDFAALGVTLIPDHSDLAAIEAGLDAALAHQQKEHVHD